MKLLLKLVVLVILIVILINLYIMLITNRKIISYDKIDDDDFDCILVLGAGIRNKQPSPMLEDRLKTAYDMYQKGVSKKILVSGDHQYNDYDEVNVMKDYLISLGIPSDDIFMDHAGLSTYDSMYRAKYIFSVNKMVVVTQKYHLYRALYIAKSLNINSVGISANKRQYAYQFKRDVREVAARLKDFFKCMIRPNSTYLGEKISIKGDGNKTNDDK